MANLNVAMIGPSGYGKDIGKMGTNTDIVFYNLRKDENTVTMIEPVKYPERLAPLFYAVSMAHFGIMVVDRIDHVFGEAILMLDRAGVDRGLIVLRNYIVPEQVAPLIEGTVAENYEFFDDDVIEIRGRLIQEVDRRISDQPSMDAGEGGSVPIDHHFSVKGVGTVVLGSVSEGLIRKHDKLRVLPGKGVVTVRSIQKHDDDCDWAVEGERVGLALKGVDSEELDRGFVLTNRDPIRVESVLEAGAEIVKYWPEPLRTDMVLHIGHWMQFVPCRLERVENGEDWRHPRLTISLEKELVFPGGSRAVLMYLDGEKLRVVGTLFLE